MTTRKAAAITGFVVLGLAPSWVDWVQSPERRPLMVASYAAGVALICWGLL